MRPFIYIHPQNEKEAFTAALATENSKYLGGGTNLLDLMKEDVERPSQLVEIADLNFNKISEHESGGYTIGAMLSNADTANHQKIRENYPLLSMAMLSAATAQIRNMATNGGNLLQRTRCPYFFETSMPCNKREPGTGCGALNGMNSQHAIFGWNEKCIAVNPSDMCVALAALDAKVLVQKPEGDSRTIDFKNFHRLPEDKPELDNSLEPNELITAIELPEPMFSDHYDYLKIRERSSYAFALISVAAGLQIKDGSIAKAGLAMGGVAHKPWKLTASEEFLTGKKPTSENFKKAAELAMKDARPLSDNSYKIEIGIKAIERALTQAFERKA
ncbi:FAD binding domain-containing protein [Aequorivita echinoideorum]|uniref:Xanthine dehydrogenase family protein subunit M n=1 Tax=Aequorivita echinoideorum TaxID=1549647 RepID=A0ABS5S4K2_9FLAO|nr:xanthine dehydrogenase family protein subunit M [Aequorivita echinoideorum]MBT0608124.1 xanthine dehydrogenase family protein subunit M [Aequorivita echinoideorum]